MLGLYHDYLLCSYHILYLVLVLGIVILTCDVHLCVYVNALMYVFIYVYSMQTAACHRTQLLQTFEEQSGINKVNILTFRNTSKASDHEERDS